MRAPTLGNVRTLAVFAVAAVLIVAACGNSSPTPARATAAPATAGPSTAGPSAAGPSAAGPSAAGPSASASTGASGAPIPSFVLPSFTPDRDLEAALPDTYQGQALRKFSFSGPDMLTSANQSNADFLALLQTLGKTTADLSFAVAADDTNKLGVSFGAYRIKGVDASSWTGTLFDLGRKENPGTVTTDLTLGGRSVTRVAVPGQNELSYVWPNGEILFLVITGADDLAAGAIAAMP